MSSDSLRPKVCWCVREFGVLELTLHTSFKTVGPGTVGFLCTAVAGLAVQCLGGLGSKVDE